ncbi:MAG: T9SS type A sorting domain-containing protein [Bacteroidales bacterium]|nr:T9SS type A sorting domain-containing protein [Bacteroidales bacterium]
MNTAADELTIIYHVPTSIEILKKEGISIYSYDGFVIVEFSKPNSMNFRSGNIEIYSLNGSLVKKENLENNSEFRTYLNDQRGIYLVKLTLDRNVYYAKIQN